MSQLGEQLRHARENQGISLAQAAVETRILQQSLLALEEGAFHRLPGDVATRGFIRNYAQYLGLSAEEMIELYRRERGATDKIRVVPATNPPRSRSYSMPSFLGAFFVTIALVGLTYVALNALGRFGSGESASLPAAPTQAATPTILPTAEPGTAMAVLPIQPTALPTAPATGSGATPVAGGSNPTAVGAGPTPIVGGAAPTATPDAPIVVEVKIDGSANSWLLVQVDNVTTLERIMNPGESEVFTARRQIYIRAGNPPAVQVSVNGLAQGAIGVTPGRPVDWYWPPR